MSEGPIPNSWKEAVPVVIWVVLILAFGFLFADSLGQLFSDPLWRAAFAFVAMVGLLAMLIYRAWLLDRFRSVSGGWVIAVIITMILVLALSPYIQERRWPTIPFYKVTGSSVTFTVTRGNPGVGKAVAAAVAPLESQLKAKDEELAALKQQLKDAHSPAATGEEISHLLKDFQRVSAEEHYMAVTMRVDIPYFRFDTQGVPRPVETAPITADERKDWHDFLENLRGDCVTLNLPETRDAIDNALGYFANIYTDANRFTSWQAYHEVSTALLSEVARKGIGSSGDAR